MTQPNAQITQIALARGIATVKSAVAARSTLPVLGNILVQTYADGLEFRATNLEISIVHRESAKVSNPFALCIPAKQLADYVNSLPPDTVSLTLNEKTQTLVVECGRFKANIKGIDASEFPVISLDESTSDAFTVSSHYLKSVISRIVPSAARDDSRPVLTAVCMQLGNPNFVVSADGFRLAILTTTAFVKEGDKRTVLIPAKALNEFGKLITQDEDVTVLIAQNSSSVALKLSNTTFVTQLLEGNFPDFTQIVPKSSTIRVEVDSSEFLNAIQAQSVFAREASNIMRLAVRAEGANEEDVTQSASLTVTGQSAETGDGKTELEATVVGESLEIAFNALFLKEAVTACQSEQVALEFTTNVSPGVVKPVGDDSFVVVLMPMHIGR